jgi:hypothetical protein
MKYDKPSIAKAIIINERKTHCSFVYEAVSKFLRADKFSVH